MLAILTALGLAAGALNAVSEGLAVDPGEDAVQAGERRLRRRLAVMEEEEGVTYELSFTNGERLDLLERDGLERGEVRLEVVVIASAGVWCGTHSGAEGWLDAWPFASDGHGDGGAGVFRKVEVDAF